MTEVLNIDPPISISTDGESQFPLPWHTEVARLISIGYSLPQISVQTGISVAELISLAKNEEFVQLSKEVARDITQTTIELRLRLEMAAQSALDTIIDLMHGSRSDIVRRMAANDILDRSGHSAVQKHEISQTVVIDDRRADLILQSFNETNKPKELTDEK